MPFKLEKVLELLHLLGWITTGGATVQLMSKKTANICFEIVHLCLSLPLGRLCNRCNFRISYLLDHFLQSVNHQIHLCLSDD